MSDTDKNVLSNIKHRHVGVSLMCLDEDSVTKEITRLREEVDNYHKYEEDFLRWRREL